MIMRARCYIWYGANREKDTVLRKNQIPSYDLRRDNVMVHRLYGSSFSLCVRASDTCFSGFWRVGRVFFYEAVRN